MYWMREPPTMFFWMISVFLVCVFAGPELLFFYWVRFARPPHPLVFLRLGACTCLWRFSAGFLQDFSDFLWVSERFLRFPAVFWNIYKIFDDFRRDFWDFLQFSEGFLRFQTVFWDFLRFSEILPISYSFLTIQADKGAPQGPKKSTPLSYNRWF